MMAVLYIARTPTLFVYLINVKICSLHSLQWPTFYLWFREVNLAAENEENARMKC